MRSPCLYCITRRSGIGYKRPPAHTQFAPGVSGNPAGRPKGARGFAQELREELGESIEVPLGEQVVRVTKQRALIKRLVTSAIEGDPRAMAIVVGFCARGTRDSEEPDAPPDEREILEALATHAPERTSARSGANNVSSPEDTDDQ